MWGPTEFTAFLVFFFQNLGLTNEQARGKARLVRTKRFYLHKSASTTENEPSKAVFLHFLNPHILKCKDTYRSRSFFRGLKLALNTFKIRRWISPAGSTSVPINYLVPSSPSHPYLSHREHLITGWCRWCGIFGRRSLLHRTTSRVVLGEKSSLTVKGDKAGP